MAAQRQINKLHADPDFMKRYQGPDHEIRAVAVAEMEKHYQIAYRERRWRR